MNKPLIITSKTVKILTVVKMLFIILDSFTPTDNTIASNKTMKNEKKSGYGARKSTFIGINSRKKCDMRLPISESRYTLRPRATLDVPKNSN